MPLLFCGRLMGSLLLILVGAGASFAASDPSVNGPFASAFQTVNVPGTQNATLVTDVYFPGSTATGVDQAARPCPVIVLGHGFAQSRSRHVNQGLQLATRGLYCQKTQPSSEDGGSRGLPVIVVEHPAELFLAADAALFGQ
jgi:predicted dienelactone hydrolase